jgi:hypothetical protein
MSYGGGLRPGEILINDDTPQYMLGDAVVGGEHKARGLVPRDYSTHPQGCYAPIPAWSVDMPLIPRSEWSDRIKEKVATRSQLSDIRLAGNNGQGIPSLDQNGRGYCWMHSGTSCLTVLRAVMNQPYVGLSAYGPACVIKGYRDEGGWGAQGVDFLASRGVPSEKFWPMKATSRSYDNPETWANAALHKVTEGWIDLAAAQYNRNLTFDQVATCLLLNQPVVGDFNFWSHSVCLLDLVETSPGRFGVRIWNSWGDGWSDRGMGVLDGSRAVPDGGVALRVTTPSVV